tara:strand:- start:24 stop:347 length:324 start_codon:yes stop_codon:yes gene_type:complete
MLEKGARTVLQEEKTWEKKLEKAKIIAEERLDQAKITAKNQENKIIQDAKDSAKKHKEDQKQLSDNKYQNLLQQGQKYAQKTLNLKNKSNALAKEIFSNILEGENIR